MLDILTVVLNTPKKPTGTHFSSTVDHGVSEMVSVIVQFHSPAARENMAANISSYSTLTRVISIIYIAHESRLT